MLPILLPYEDQAEIDIAIASYYRGLDIRDRELYLSAFHPDAVGVSSVGGAKRAGPDHPHPGSIPAGEFFDLFWNDPESSAFRYGTHDYGHGLVTSFEADRIERWSSITFLPHPQNVAEAGFRSRARETLDTFVRVDGHWKYLVKDLTQRAALPPLPAQS